MLRRFLAGLGLALLAPQPAHAQALDVQPHDPTAEIVNYAPTDVTTVVYRTAAAEGINPDAAICVAKRETGLNPRTASNPPYVGLYQLGPSELSGFYGSGGTDWTDPRQITRYFALRIKQGADTHTWPTLAACPPALP